MLAANFIPQQFIINLDQTGVNVVDHGKTGFFSGSNHCPSGRNYSRPMLTPQVIYHRKKIYATPKFKFQKDCDITLCDSASTSGG